jgi:hypothetical protein
MSRIYTYEGNTIYESKSYLAADCANTTLSGFTVKLHIMQNKDDYHALLTATGTVSGQGVVFTIPADSNTLDKGTYYYEVVAESSVNKFTLEQDRLFVKESIVYLS